MKLFRCFSLFAAFFVLTACSSVTVKDYAQEKPVLKLEEYFNGTLDAHGVFQGRDGMIKQRFHVLIKASWKDGVGTLDEDFTYSDGTKSRRVWTLRPQGNGKYTGTASDVVGEAKGEVAGNAFHWKYVLDLKVGEKTYRVNFDDWMWLMDDKVMLNKSAMSKFGFHLGDVILSFSKRSP